jgi:acylphosphatase
LTEVIRRFLVFGKVQGVFFRHSTRMEANRLAIRGSAHNMPDGSVEIVAQGKEAAVAELRAWLQRGPPDARVEEVREPARETAAAETAILPEGFHIF